MEEFKIVQIKDIQKNPYQPRKEFFRRKKYKSWHNPLRKTALIQPIIVRKSPVLGYEILAGERRYRASIAAGLSEIPVIIKQLSDQDMMLHSIIEKSPNAKNLNPIEEAKAYQVLNR